MIVVTAANRKPAATNDERAALLGSMIAYTGKYTLEGDRIITEVDASWNEIYTGTLRKQTRLFKIEGGRLTVDTGEIESAVFPGKRIVAALTFEREN